MKYEMGTFFNHELVKDAVLSYVETHVNSKTTQQENICSGYLKIKLQVQNDETLTTDNVVRVAISLDRARLKGNLSKTLEGSVIALFIDQSFHSIEKCRLDLLSDPDMDGDHYRSRWVSLLDNPQDDEDLCLIWTPQDTDRFSLCDVVDGILNIITTAITTACCQGTSI